MKLKLTNLLSLALAALLQFMPLLRSALPSLQSIGSPTGSFIMRWVVGGTAYFGYHAISGASGIAISPPTATIGSPYAGTITYSGGHAGQVSSMSMTNSCLGSYSFAPGLTVTYSGGYTASVTGTPTGALGTVPFTLKMFDAASCGSGETDTRSTSLIIQNSGGGPAGPAISVAPQSVVAQVGSTVILSGGATGNPAPSYYWKQGITFIPGATNNTLTIPAVQLANAGLYTMVASNATSQANSACYLSVALTPGSNILAYLYTNYVVANTAVTMSSAVTNVPSGSNTYDWTYNTVDTGVTTSNFTLSASLTTPINSGTYSIFFKSVVGSTTIVNQGYDSYWAFGYLPRITNQPVSQTVGSGSNATFTVTVGGTMPTLLWYQNATNLVSVQPLTFNPSSSNTTTNVSLVISNVTSANAGTYSVVISNYWGTTTSSNATLTVGSSLGVSAPQSQTNYVGKNIAFSVTPSGTAPFTYQWQKGGVNLANAGVISGVTTSVLGIAPAGTGNSGSYDVIVNNASGSITSSVAVLSIVPVPPLTVSASAGNFVLNAGGGVATSPYIVQYSTNLLNTNGWIPLKTNTVPANGSISFTDTNAISGQRFYRLQFP